MWAYGLVWIFFALASISRGKFPFNLSWWGFTFPLGVWASATISIGQEMPSRFVTVLGTVSGRFLLQILNLSKECGKLN